MYKYTKELKEITAPLKN